MSASDLGGASSAPGGMEFTWPSEVSIEDILAAAERRARYLAGEEIPARQKRKSRRSGRCTGMESDAARSSADAGQDGAGLAGMVPTLDWMVPALAQLIPLAEHPCWTRRRTIRRARMP